MKIDESNAQASRISLAEMKARIAQAVAKLPQPGQGKAVPVPSFQPALKNPVPGPAVTPAPGSNTKH